MGPPTSSFELAERVKSGDQDAFARLFEKYRGRLAVFLYYRLGPALRASCELDDLVQDTFLRAFRDFGSFEYRTPGSLFRWLASIAAHAATDRARYEGRERRAAELVPLGGPEPVDSATPSRLLAQKENIRRLLRRLDELPEDYRQAIVLAKFEGLSTAEMAERMGRSREQAALLLHRALKRFRALAEN